MNAFAAWEIAINIYVHIVPLIMTSLTFYFTDLKMLKGDWKLTLWHGLLYIFFNWLGTEDYGHLYPIIDWKSYPETLAYAVFGVCCMAGAWYGICSCFESTFKRRGAAQN